MPDAFRFEPATQATEASVRALLRDNPVTGDIQVSLEREPNALYAAAVSGDNYQVILAYSGNDPEPVGLGARFELEAWVNGESQTMGYLSELRVTGGFRYRRKLLVNAYRSLRHYHEQGAAPFYLTTIMADNVAARRLLEAGVSDLPCYQPLENLVTLVIPTRAGSRTRTGGIAVESANNADLPDITDMLERCGRGLQFSPRWSEHTLTSPVRCRGLSTEDFFVVRESGAIRACLALWDQRGFKQSVVRGYGQSLGRIRALYNLAAPVMRRPRLPPPGAGLNHAFLSHLAVSPDDSEAALALVRSACLEAGRRGIDYVLVGLAERNPLCRVLAGRFPCHRYTSIMYVVYWEDGKKAAEMIDGRLPHPELAIL
jgi:hypothetical protein